MEDQTLQFSSHFIVEKKMIYDDAGQPTENKKQEKERGEQERGESRRRRSGKDRRKSWEEEEKQQETVDHFLFIKS
jgi:hypothetical protein